MGVSVVVTRLGERHHPRQGVLKAVQGADLQLAGALRLAVAARGFVGHEVGAVPRDDPIPGGEPRGGVGLGLTITKAIITAPDEVKV